VAEPDGVRCEPDRGQEPPLDPWYLSDPATYVAGVPHAELARLRREAPVAWVEEKPLWRTGSRGERVATRGTGYWAVTRHATVTLVCREREVFSSAHRGVFLADPKSRRDLERTRQFLINMDAPEHKRLRQFVALAFTPRTVAVLVDRIRAEARSLVDGIRERGRFDVVRDLAAELPLISLADLLGIPREDRGLLYEWSNNLVGFDDPEYGGGRVDVYQKTFADAFRYSLELAEAKRRRPGDDLVTGLVTTQVDGGQLNEREYCHLWVMLVVAGNETTRHLLSGSLLALSEWPEQRRRLEDGAAVDVAVEEMLRWVSPVMQFCRTAMRDFELEGQHIREGDKVALYWASANRDESVFAAPDRLDLLRHPNHHLAFGIGPHFCLGAHLARLEARAMLEALRPHLAAFELDGRPVRLASNFMNAIKSMPARFAPRSAAVQMRRPAAAQ
jgi:cytochrome P450